MLKTIYDFPYCSAAQLSHLLPVGTINPQLRAYQDQRREAQDVAGQSPKVWREILRRMQQSFHAQGGAYVQRHKIDNNSPILGFFAQPPSCPA